MELTTIFSKSTMVRSKPSSYLMHGPEVLSKPTMVRSKPPSYLMGAPDVLSKPTMVRSKPPHHIVLFLLSHQHLNPSPTIYRSVHYIVPYIHLSIFNKKMASSFAYN